MKKTSRQYQWQLKKKEAGLCRTCGKKAINKTYCKVHNDLNLERMKKYASMPVLDSFE